MLSLLYSRFSEKDPNELLVTLVLISLLQIKCEKRRLKLRSRDGESVVVQVEGSPQARRPENRKVKRWERGRNPREPALGMHPIKVRWRRCAVVGEKVTSQKGHCGTADSCGVRVVEVVAAIQPTIDHLRK